ncbi:MAG: 50S ribosomal protein L5, partial [Planctomycetota bacterium]
MPAATREIPRLQKAYREQVIAKVLKEFGLKNPNQAPKVAKIIVSTGVGKRLENQKLKPEHKEAVIDTYRKITGQQPIMIKAKKAVSNFKVR